MPRSLLSVVHRTISGTPMQLLGAEPKLLLTTMGIDVVELDALLVARCQPTMSVADLEALRIRVPEILARRPAGLSGLFVVPDNALNLMDERRRCACVELATELEPLLRARAYVVPRTSSSDARTAVSTIGLLAGSPRAHRGLSRVGLGAGLARAHRRFAARR